MTKGEREQRMMVDRAAWLMKHWNAPFITSVEKEKALKLWRTSASVGVDLNRQDLSTVLEWVLDNYVLNRGEEGWW